ncbi:hypothetical protein like AT5G57070 [Hibiscus trionum]|uniref:Hydroxyproline-rich glycoprotein family protein n=1 Tax=Hibiscus trionum TaxID=183268 RepID=A0A9W7M3P2_HIBTR|nr:hypothetical protein like AT5G57070 [Hibiscus trionum]
MEITGEPPPLWPQLATTSMHPRRRRSPSSLFTPPVLIILLPTIALLILFFAVPPFLSTIAGQIFRPTGVKKNSDSFNIFLVFFAILCGVFARRNDGDVEDNSSIRNEYDVSNKNKQSHLVSQRWFDQYPERKIYDDHPPVNAAAMAAEATGVRRLKRSSSSYPDLRQDSLWENCEDRSRFFDDFEINRYRSTTNNYNDQAHGLRRSWRNDHFEESEPKVIPCDTFVFRSSPSSPLPSMSPAPSTPPPPPPPPPPAAAYHRPRRTYQAVGQKEKVKKRHMEFDESESPSPNPVTPPPPPPPPPRRPPSPLVQTGNRSELRYAKLERRRSNATKEIKMVFASLRKRKKKKAKDHNHDPQHDYPLHSQSEPPPHYSTTIPPPSPPPPPPPPLPPPPSSVFQKYNLFRSKASKSKKVHSAPPPPPPPPPFSLSKFMQSTQTPPTTPPPAPSTPPPEPSRRRTTAKANRCRPPLPTKANTSSYYDENVNSGGQSPLIPKPPPPPPFKMSELKFVFSGDFVKIRSSPSSRCSSPDIEEVNVPSSKDDEETVSMMDGDDGGGVGGVPVPVVCPSPDVNAKAETFIARLRDGWKLEKINSMKEKQRI